MADFLLRLASLSAGGAAAVALLLIVERLAGLRYAAKWRCLAWLLLCLRLAVPFTFSWNTEQPAAPIQFEVPADTVIYRPATRPNPQGTPPAVQEQPNGAQPLPEQSGQGAAEPARTVTLSEALFTVWTIGAVGVLGWALLGHIRFLRYIRRWGSPILEREIGEILNELADALGLRRAPRLLTCPGLETPMLAGLLRPCLLLPAEPMDSARLRHALLHELTHCKRRDIAFKALVLWVCALHWFNPAVWLMRRAVERDLELACDDAALRVLPESERAAYGNTVLMAATKKKGIKA